MEDFTHQHMIGRHADGEVWVTVKYENGRLSITGVTGPKRNGDAFGSCGQIVDTLTEQINGGWSAERIAELHAIWQRWHLNDMRAGTPSQENHLRKIKHRFPGYPTSFYEWAKEELRSAGLQPDAGHGDYSYGSSWLTEEVPAEVLTRLCDTDVFPLATKNHPWGDD